LTKTKKCIGLTEHASEPTGAEEALAARLAVASSQWNVAPIMVSGIRDWIGCASPSWITTLPPRRYVAVYVSLEVDVLITVTVI
jgi:hypothetical protein